MELSLKTNCEETLNRWERYWRGENMDRPMLCAVIPKPGVEPVKPVHQYDFYKGDLEANARSVLAWAQSHEFLGDLLPVNIITFAPDHFALLLGADMDFGHGNSGWIVPFLKYYDQEIRFRPEGRWWELTVKAIRAARKVCDGQVLIAAPHLQANLDALAAIRDAQQLLQDLVLCPDDVQRALEQIDRAVVEVRAALAEELDVTRFGSANRFGAWAPAIAEAAQSDFSCMISAEMFREFALPHLKEELSMVHGAVYHLDGPDNIRHLEAVCEVDKIACVQWQPGAGAPATMDWTELYQRIDDLGKGHFRRDVTPEMVKESWKRLRSPRMIFHVKGIESRDQMDRLIDDLVAMERDA